jgi:hypothetical protein
MKMDDMVLDETPTIPAWEHDVRVREPSHMSSGSRSSTRRP